MTVKVAQEAKILGLEDLVCGQLVEEALSGREVVQL
jgi:hypothetical protein